MGIPFPTTPSLQEAGSGVIFKELGFSDVSLEGVDGLVPGHFHHFEQRGPAFCGTGDKSGAQTMRRKVPLDEPCQGGILFDDLGYAEGREGIG